MALQKPVENDKEVEDADIETRIKTKISQAHDQLNVINDELRLICESNAASMFNSNNPNETTPSHTWFGGGANSTCSLFIENNLYPQFNIYIDTSKLIADIKELSLRIGPNNVLSPRVMVSEDPNLNTDVYKICQNDTRLDCEVRSGIGSDGVFWLQLLSCDDVDFLQTSNINSSIRLG